jgi:hypothetical protein
MFIIIQLRVIIMKNIWVCFMSISVLNVTYVVISVKPKVKKHSHTQSTPQLMNKYKNSLFVTK